MLGISEPGKRAGSGYEVPSERPDTAELCPKNPDTPEYAQLFGPAIGFPRSSTCRSTYGNTCASACWCAALNETTMCSAAPAWSLTRAPSTHCSSSRPRHPCYEGTLHKLARMACR